ncbi:hypothetical protein MKEN_00740600 [Mycena kentingensis (nom. inval.)]|nr:hypothetical protein MKEN_00740600 [Mycena kentingensis (nom. inval.)]
MTGPALPPAQRVPNEVLSLICDNVSDPKALVSLCQTSRLFLVLAQPSLYHRVILDGKRIQTLRNWCVAVATHPHLAKRVHSLTASLPNLSALEPNDAEKMVTALRACVNLKELQMSSCSLNLVPGSPWMLEDCSFQLTIFRGSYFCLDRTMLRFLASQKAIQVLEVPRWVGSDESDLIQAQFREATPATLPNLIAVSGPLETLPLNYPLRRIQTDPSSRPLLTPLAQYGSTLTTLNLVLPTLSMSIHPSKLIWMAAWRFPALLHFALVEIGTTGLASTSARLRLVGPPPSGDLWRFSSLETFTLFSRNLDFTRSSSSVSITYPCNTEHGMRELAIDTLNSRATLTRAVIGYQVTPEKEWMCTATRVPGGVPKTILQDGMDFEAVSMFAA